MKTYIFRNILNQIESNRTRSGKKKSIRYISNRIVFFFKSNRLCRSSSMSRAGIAHWHSDIYVRIVSTYRLTKYTGAILKRLGTATAVKIYWRTPESAPCARVFKTMTKNTGAIGPTLPHDPAYFINIFPPPVRFSSKNKV